MRIIVSGLAPHVADDESARIWFEGHLKASLRDEYEKDVELHLQLEASKNDDLSAVTVSIFNHDADVADALLQQLVAIAIRVLYEQRGIKATFGCKLKTH